MEKKKKLIIFAHYYAPDVASTGQIIQDQAEGMKNEFDVTVVCTVPSYTGVIDEKYKNNKFYKEEMNGVNIIRVPVPGFNKNNKISRIKNILFYFFNARRITRKLKDFDYVMTISQPPILGGMLGVYGKNKLRTSKGDNPKLVYCIQDFNPEQIIATGYIKCKFLIKMAMLIDKRSCLKSDMIITVGRDLVETINNRFNGCDIPKNVLINNWIDDKEIFPLESHNPGVISFKHEYGLENKFVIMYSGNIGLYYDLEGIMSVIGKFRNAKTKDGKDVAFAFVGSGSVLEKLISYKKDHELDNVVFIPYQNKSVLIYSLNAANVHWCVNAKGIKGVSCPSKFYGIAAVGKPVLGILEKGSECEALIKEVKCGLVSEPGNYEQIENNVKWFIDNSNSNELLEMGMRGYCYFIKHFTKDIGVKKYINVFKGL